MSKKRYLATQDLEQLTKRRCEGYLSHENRTEDTDDALLDAANQLDLSLVELTQWIYSEKSTNFMQAWASYHVSPSDFSESLKSFL